MSEWNRLSPLQTFLASSSYSDSGAAEAVPLVDDCGDLFTSFAFTGIDYTDSALFHAQDFDNHSMVVNSGSQDLTGFDNSSGSLAVWSGVGDGNMGGLNAQLLGETIPFSATPVGPTGITSAVPQETISGPPSSTLRSPSSDKSSSKKRSSPDSASSPEDVERVTKRQRNTEAARRYRQRKMDRVSELEEALASMTQERDDLKLKLARSQAEADVLRGMVGGRS